MAKLELFATSQLVHLATRSLTLSIELEQPYAKLTFTSGAHYHEFLSQADDVIEDILGQLEAARDQAQSVQLRETIATIWRELNALQAAVRNVIVFAKQENER